MADHGSGTPHTHGFDEHARTYATFVKGAIGLTLLCLYVLVALVSFAFIHSGNLLIGFGGLIIGVLALIVDLRAGNNWYISLGWLVIFALFTAVMLG